MKFLLPLLFLLPIMSYAQEDEFTVCDDTIYETPDKLPEFPGGKDALYQYVGKKLEYPNEAKDNCTQGIVYVKFCIYKDGKVKNISITKGIGSGCDEAVVKIIRNMPRWSPGEVGGRVVSVWYTLPVKFELQGCDKKSPEKN